ncbi:hypothetical protein H8959_004347, partial [Pygathrix nigripes]
MQGEYAQWSVPIPGSIPDAWQCSIDLSEGIQSEVAERLLRLKCLLDAQEIWDTSRTRQQDQLLSSRLQNSQVPVQVSESTHP